MREPGAIIDISVPIDETLVTWPGDPRPEFHAVKRFSQDGMRLTRLVLGTHTGTHVDAPSHLVEEGTRVDALSLKNFVGPCRVVDLSEVPDVIRHDDIERIEPRAGERLLLRTRNSELLSRPDFTKDFVYLAPDAASRLVGAGVRLIGIDYLSVEGGDIDGAPSHTTLLNGGVAILETVDLRGVRPGTYTLVAAPLRLRGLDGSPVRALLLRP